MSTELWNVVERYAHQGAGRLQSRVTSADISRATDNVVSEQLLSKWRRTPTLPEPHLLAVLAAAVRAPYMELLEAALTDRGYLPVPLPTVGPSGDTDGGHRPYSAAVSEAIAKVPPRSRRRVPKH